MSIVMPVNNEAPTIERAIDAVLAVDFPCDTELIVVDDGSTDGTGRLLANYTEQGVRLLTLPVNVGKGAAVRAGVGAAGGTHVIILDADLEYSPRDIPAMLEPVIARDTDHVFGARVFGFNASFPSFRFALGGRLTTWAANVLFDACLTDMHTCLKLLPIEDFRRLHLAEDGFGLDTQLTARLLHAGVRPYEVPVSYRGRTVAQGKKITWLDGVLCLAILLRVRLSRRPTLGPVLAAVPTPTGSGVTSAGSGRGLRSLHRTPSHRRDEVGDEVGTADAESVAVPQ